ncbi:MAG: serine protease [Acidobacteria bacterium]|nr:serine protease [Acidobacteriota bacterium]
MSVSVFEQFKKACGLIKTEKSMGTGYLVAGKYVATCDHVVRSIPVDGKVTVYFGEQQLTATLVKRNEKADCALLELSAPLAGVAPLKLTQTVDSATPWRAYGFPGITQGAGLALTGDVLDPNGIDPSKSDAIVLFSHQIAIGKGAQPQGFSGTPVNVNGYIIGHLKRIIPTNQGDELSRAEMGILYACPTRYIEEMLPPEAKTPELEPQPPFSHFDLAWYINRPKQENRALSYLKNGSPAVLRGPSKFGKTTIFSYLLHKLQTDSSQKFRIFHLHLGLFDPKSKQNLDVFLKELARQIFRQMSVALPDQPDFESLWNRNDQQLKDFLQNVVLPYHDSPVVLAIDEADSIRDMENSEKFFEMLRALVEYGATSSLWRKFRLLMSISDNPSRLIKSSNKSPFNVTQPILLQDFTPEQVEQLSHMYGLHWNADQIKQVMDVVGGHPYLVRHVMYETAFSESLPDLSEESLFFEGYLDNYQQSLRQDSQLIEELSHYTSGQSISCQNKDACDRLVKAGILIEEKSKHFRLRYGLYRRLIS